MDATLNASFALTLLLIGSYAVYAKQLVPVWINRKEEFYSIKEHWNSIILLSATAAVTVVYFLFYNREAPTNVTEFFYKPEAVPVSVIVMVGLLTFVSVLAACSDFFISRAPAEPTDLLFYLGFPFMLYFGGFDDVISKTAESVTSSGWSNFFPALGDGFVTADWSGLVSAGIWFLCPIILAYTAGRGIGDADLYYLAAITTTVSWWAGWYITFMLFGLGCLIQICMYFVFQALNMGERRMIKPSPTMLSVKRILLKISPSLNLDVSGKKVSRYYTPLLPALAIAYIGGSLFLLLTGNSMLLINGGVGIFGT